MELVVFSEKANKLMPVLALHTFEKYLTFRWDTKIVRKDIGKSRFFLRNPETDEVFEITHRLKQFPKQKLLVKVGKDIHPIYKVHFEKGMIYHYDAKVYGQSSVTMHDAVLLIELTSALPLYEAAEYYTTETIFPTKEFIKEGVI